MELWGMRVLVVEDDPSLRELIEIWLTDEFRLTCVDGAKAAVNVLASEPDCDLLITDFNMPEMDGLDLLRWCRKHDLHFPVIFMTASRILLPREEVALSDCCAEILPKPLSRSALTCAVIRARERAHDRDCQSPDF